MELVEDNLKSTDGKLIYSTKTTEVEPPFILLTMGENIKASSKIGMEFLQEGIGYQVIWKDEEKTYKTNKRYKITLRVLNRLLNITEISKIIKAETAKEFIEVDSDYILNNVELLNYPEFSLTGLHITSEQERKAMQQVMNEKRKVRQNKLGEAIVLNEQTLEEIQDSLRMKL